MTNVFFDYLENQAVEYFENLGLAWWLSVITDQPKCIYYFGPFICAKEAKAHQTGYLEDLMEEGATIVSVSLHQRESPKVLTIAEDD